ncbi:MAG: siphovirus ReqiPepy6 Gp37-like family protein [Eubacteriales bacterium]|nr:siphovirus ReqiPepy6 Gp37-like family protein [Eubacteriales bacterium]
MELIGLDASFKPVKTLKCINIQWNRRYYEAGDYQLQLRAADWEPTIAYVYTPLRPETGMVEKIETEHTIKGDFVLVSGFFLEGMLNWKTVYPRYQATGNLSDTCRVLVALHMADTGVFTQAASALGSDAAFDSLGDPLGDVMYGALKLQAFSQRVRLDYERENLLYEVWQGLDRTQTQQTHTYAVFSQHFGTADEMTLTQDQSGYRNYAIAQYEGGALEVDLRGDGVQPKRVLYLDTGLSPADGQSEANFLAAVATAARTQLAQYARIVNVEVSVLQSNLLYLRDYDLGDLCDVRDDRLGLAFEARIIEAAEVWKANTHTISLQFGDKLPTVYRRGRQ